MNSPITMDSTETLGPSATGRSHGERSEHETVRVEPAGAGEIDDAEAVEKFGDGVPAERDEAPEHERVRQAGDGPLDDGLSLAHDVDEEALRAKTEVVDREGIGGGRDQADARRDLRGEQAGEHQHQDPEDERSHRSAFSIQHSAISYPAMSSTPDSKLITQNS
jgi:hypothetical protein